MNYRWINFTVIVITLLISGFSVNTFAITKAKLSCPFHEDKERYLATTYGINPKVLHLALKAYNCARKQGLDSKQVLAIINYSLPSNKKRLWVLDMKTNKLLYHGLVAQGKATGLKYAKHFSDVENTHESSIGLFVAGQPYIGHDGLALHLFGLESSFNDKAYDRHIVMHGAWYVNEHMVRRLGRIGRSWGCPAVNKDAIHQLVDRLKGGGLIFSYFPNKKWLKTSKYIHCKPDVDLITGLKKLPKK